MKFCQYYEAAIYTRDGEIRRDGQVGSFRMTSPPQCLHPRSSLSIKGMGCGELLTCRGILDSCIIPENLRDLE